MDCGGVRLGRLLIGAFAAQPECVRHFQTYGGWQRVDDRQSEHQRVAPYCYADAETNCRRYGRLYIWESAQRVCQSFGAGWRLPTDDEWRQMARRYGGIGDDSVDQGRGAFNALLSGGMSGFNAVLGGNRSPNGQYRKVRGAWVLLDCISQ